MSSNKFVLCAFLVVMISCVVGEVCKWRIVGFKADCPIYPENCRDFCPVIRHDFRQQCKIMRCPIRIPSLSQDDKLALMNQSNEAKMDTEMTDNHDDEDQEPNPAKLVAIVVASLLGGLLIFVILVTLCYKKCPLTCPLTLRTLRIVRNNLNNPTNPPLNNSLSISLPSVPSISLPSLPKISISIPDLFAPSAPPQQNILLPG